MRNRIKQLMRNWKADDWYRTLLTSAVSAAINFAFTAFNGVLGIVSHSLWHGSICVYYLFLALIRMILVHAQRNEPANQPEAMAEHRRRVCVGTHRLLLLMDFSLIVPIAVMAKGERSYPYGLIPAITMAAYTTYRITMSILHFRKSRRNDNILVSELRMINLTDALLALLTLQNALMIATDGVKKSTKILSAWTSAGILALIVIITNQSFSRAKRS